MKLRFTSLKFNLLFLIFDFCSGLIEFVHLILMVFAFELPFQGFQSLLAFLFRIRRLIHPYGVVVNFYISKYRSAVENSLI